MQNISDLLQLCQNIAGMTIGELAVSLKRSIPKSPKHKGWVGQLLEEYLGATGKNLPIADFPNLEIELKTIPINPITLVPLESTFVCSASLNKPMVSWEKSIVKIKLAKVLWIPIGSLRSTELADRRIGKAFLWQPTLEQEAVLRQDWEELTEMLQLGNIQLLSAKYGRYLQIRPKAANCKDNLVNYITRDGELIKTVNRGFYLRTCFTKQIMLQQRQVY